MRVLSFNVNGIRAAARKGFYDWLADQDADVVCLQEIKAQPEQLDTAALTPTGYHCFYESGVRKGYSGVAVFTRHEPNSITRGFRSKEFDPEGRYLEIQHGNLSIISLYVPSGTSGPHRQQAKYRFMRAFSRHLRKLERSGRDYLICGDWNIAHKEIDLENDRANQKNSGFLPEERAWLDRVFGPFGFVDVFRALNQEPRQYTWWSNRHPTTRERNIGWRIDYQVATPAVAARARNVAVDTDVRFSDHAPLIFDYEMS